MLRWFALVGVGVAGVCVGGVAHAQDLDVTDVRLDGGTVSAQVEWNKRLVGKAAGLHRRSAADVVLVIQRAGGDWVRAGVVSGRQSRVSFVLSKAQLRLVKRGADVRVTASQRFDAAKDGDGLFNVAAVASRSLRDSGSGPVCQVRLKAKADAPGCVAPGAVLAGTDLSGVDLSKAVLSKADLSGARLARADLSGARLDEARLRRANLRQADASEVRARRVQATGARLRGADFTGAQLTEARMGRVDAIRARFDEADLSDAVLHDAGLGASRGERVDASSAHLQGADLGGAVWPGASLRRAGLVSANLAAADLNGADLSRANAKAAVMRAADLRYARFTGARVPAVALAKAQLAGSISGKVKGKPVSLPVNWDKRTGYLMGPGADLSGANLAGKNLSGLTLGTTSSKTAAAAGVPVGKGRKLTAAGDPATNLSGVSLYGANLSKSNLRGLDFRQATFTAPPRAAWSRPDEMTMQDWMDADVAYATFREVEFAPTNFSGINAEEADFSYVRMLSPDDAWNAALSSAGDSKRRLSATRPAMVFQDARLNRASFEGASAPEADFRNARLGGANFNYADLRGGDFSVDRVISAAKTRTHQRARLTGGLTGFWVGANLEGANFEGRDLSGNVFDQAMLSGANFAQANLDGALITDMPEAVGTDFRSANLHAAVLARGTFTDVNMSDVDLDNASITSFAFNSVDFSSARLTFNTLFESVSFTNTYLGDLRDVDEAEFIDITCDGTWVGSTYCQP